MLSCVCVVDSPHFFALFFRLFSCLFFSPYFSFPLRVCHTHLPASFIVQEVFFSCVKLRCIFCCCYFRSTDYFPFWQERLRGEGFDCGNKWSQVLSNLFVFLGFAFSNYFLDLISYSLSHFATIFQFVEWRLTILRAFLSISSEMLRRRMISENKK